MIAIGCDHGGLELKDFITEYLKKEGYEVKDFGIYENKSVDYPDIAKPVCESVLKNECDRGILICGTGIGMSIAANKFNGIRAAVCGDIYSAKMTKIHNNANIITMGARVIGQETAREIVNAWLTNEYEGGRHQNRLDKISDIEKNQRK